MGPRRATGNPPGVFIFHFPGAERKDEPIDPEESSLILQALAEIDWQPKDPKGQFQPYQAYNRLRGTGGSPRKVTGFDKPAEIEEAKEWLRNNSRTYRISKIVPVGNVEKK